MKVLFKFEDLSPPQKDNGVGDESQLNGGSHCLIMQCFWGLKDCEGQKYSFGSFAFNFYQLHTPLKTPSNTTPD